MKASLTWPNSVCVVRRNLRRTGVLKNSCRTSTVVPTGQPQGTTGPTSPPMDLQFRPASLGRRAAAEHQPADLGDRGQGLAAKAQRADAEQIVGIADFAGGVAGHGQQQLVGANAAAVVGHANQIRAALLDRHVDPRGPGVHGVLQQLLDDARRPLDDFAGRDLVDHARG